jgi:hypothetical protein
MTHRTLRILIFDHIARNENAFMVRIGTTNSGMANCIMTINGCNQIIAS